MVEKMSQRGDLNQIIHKINFHPKERMDAFLVLSGEMRASVLLHLTKHIQKEILAELNNENLINLLEHLDPDEATDVVQLLSKHRQKIIVPKLNEDLRKSVELLSGFDPQTAAGLMNVDFIKADDKETIADVAKKFRIHERRTGRLPAIIIMSDGKIAGYLPGHELGFGKPGEPVRRYIRRLQTIKHNASHDDVIRIFKNHPHNKVAVLGEDSNIIGIIYSDDALRAEEEQESASLYDFAGVSEEESVTDSVKAKVKNRYKWLIINLGTAFMAAFTVSIFNETIAKYVLLAVYMPIVAGMGGNAGTQSLAVVVRGIALRQISLKDSLPVLKRELGSGLINGVINGVVVGIVVYIINGDIKLALILAIAMVACLCVAAFFGTMVPLIMRRFGKDPATSATIFITTATDILGFLVFLGLATLILP